MLVTTDACNSDASLHMRAGMCCTTLHGCSYLRVHRAWLVGARRVTWWVRDGSETGRVVGPRRVRDGSRGGSNVSFSYFLYVCTKSKKK